MKKFLNIVLSVLMVSLMSVTALANSPAPDLTKDSTGIFEVKPQSAFTLQENNTSDKSIVIQDKDGNYVAPAPGTIAGVSTEGVHANAVKLSVSYTPSEEQDLILLLKGTEFTVNSDTIAYINQEAGKQKVTFNVYPNALEKGTPYTLWHIGSSGAKEEIASFRYNQPYKQGDINMDGVVDFSDAIVILRYDARFNEELAMPPEQLSLGHMNADAVVDFSDAIEVLKIDSTIG